MGYWGLVTASQFFEKKCPQSLDESTLPARSISVINQLTSGVTHFWLHFLFCYSGCMQCVPIKRKAIGHHCCNYPPVPRWLSISFLAWRTSLSQFVHSVISSCICLWSKLHPQLIPGANLNSVRFRWTWLFGAIFTDSVILLANLVA